MPTKTLVTAAVVAVFIAAVLWKYWDYVANPWTRNGQVMAQVIQITPRVTGTIVELPIIDNQFVKKGDLLFQIDPRTYESTLHGMEGLLAETEDEIEALAAQVAATAATVQQYDAAIKRAKQKVKGKQARLEDYQAEYKRYATLVPQGADPPRNGLTRPRPTSPTPRPYSMAPGRSCCKRRLRSSRRKLISPETRPIWAPKGTRTHVCARPRRGSIRRI
jgi:uncharacterized coiled-coil protein SlyX